MSRRDVTMRTVVDDNDGGGAEMEYIHINELLLSLEGLGGQQKKSRVLMTAADILQSCKNDPSHRSPDTTTYEQVMSSIACITGKLPANVYENKKVRLCTCADNNSQARKQGVTFLGMCGLLSVAREITQKNKPYVSKRWDAFCASTGVISVLTTAALDTLTEIAISSQKQLYQTEIGRTLARIVISSDLNPPKIQDQIKLVYTYAGLKACYLMRNYLSLAPVVLAIPSVADNARSFLTAYKRFRLKWEQRIFRTQEY